MTADELLTGLRERVLAASRHARAAGHSFPDVADICPNEAFARAVDALNGLLCALAEDDWIRPTVNQFDVHGLLGHLVAVELDMHRCILGDPDVAGLPHVESTRSAAAIHAGLPPARTRDEWRRATDRTCALVDSATMLEREVAMHRLRMPLGTLLIVRAFELWTHENDIRRAVGLPATVPDGSALRLMTAVTAGALPLAATRIGWQDPTQVRLVLTGIGGCTCDVALGDGSAEPAAVRIVTDAVAFCRLAANRVTPDELDLQVSGDMTVATRVLDAVSALAMD